MNRIIIVFLIFLTLNINSAFAFAIRCGNDLIQEGDSKFEVIMTLKKCGTVLEKELIRSEDTNKKIEIWLVRVLEMGGHYCYELIFKDAIMTERKLLNKCD